MKLLDAGVDSRTVRRVTPVPFADRVAGVDSAILGEVTAQRLALEPDELAALRFAAADFLRRHDQLFERLENGEEPRWAVCDGIVAFWPEDLELRDGLPVGGAEGCPIAATVLRNAADTATLVTAATQLGRAFRERDEAAFDVPELVCADIAEALTFAAMLEA